MAEPTTTFIDDMAPSLEAVQKLVGGYVAMITLPTGAQLLVNEEGEMLDLERNWLASDLAGGAIYGNTVVLQGKARWS